MKAIVDCNSFYCSCERLFRPDLRQAPVVVLSNNDGCIISRSDEAKALGLGMGVPYFEARHLIERFKVSVFSSNYQLYGDMSLRVMETLRTAMGGGAEGSRKVEVYSVDEAFLDFSEIPSGEILSFSRQIREMVEQWTGISVSVGVGPTKTLAKLANQQAKRDKIGTGCVQAYLDSEACRAALQGTRVDAIWGIGRAYAGKLINWGITSAWDLTNMPTDWIYKNLGGVVGLRLVKELKGEPAIDMQQELTEKKGIATTRMFGKPVTDLSELKEAVATYICRAAEKLRRQQSAATRVGVFIIPRETGNNGPQKANATLSAEAHLENATSITQELIKPALQLVEQLYEAGRTYKKAGVQLEGLVGDKSLQGNLFALPGQPQSRFLMSAVDNVNFGIREDVVKFASSGLKRNWKMRQEMRSGRTTTKWEEMKEIG